MVLLPAVRWIVTDSFTAFDGGTGVDLLGNSVKAIFIEEKINVLREAS